MDVQEKYFEYLRKLVTKYVSYRCECRRNEWFVRKRANGYWGICRCGKSRRLPLELMSCLSYKRIK